MSHVASPSTLLAALGLGLLAASPRAAALEPQSPPAAKIMADAVAAMGGKEAIDKIETMRLKASTSVMGMNMGMEASWARSGARFIRQFMVASPDMPGGGMPDMVAGSDGRTHWMKEPMGGGYSLMDQEMFDEMDEQAFLHMRLLRVDQTAEKDFKSCETVGTAEFGGRTCYKVHVVDKEDESASGDLYFDVEKGLPVGFEMKQEGAMGTEQGTAILSEWKTISGVQFFHKIAMSAQMGQMKQELEMTFSEIELKADPQVFELPEEVKKLAAAPPAAEPRKVKDLSEFTPQQQEQIKQMLAGLDQTTSAEQLEVAVKSMERSLGFVPADQKDVFEYVLEQARRKLAALKGG